MNNLFKLDNTINNYISIKQLLESGINPNIRDQTGSTPLHIQNDLNIIKLLLKAGADTKLVNNNGYNPIFYHDDFDIFKLLFESCDKNDLTDNGFMILHIDNNPELVNLFNNNNKNLDYKLSKFNLFNNYKNLLINKFLLDFDFKNNT